MAASENESFHNAGFETWDMVKKVRKEGKAGEEVFDSDCATRREEDSPTIPVSQRHPTFTSQRSSHMREKQVRNKKGKSIRESPPEAEGTVAISQKEYELFMSFKKKSVPALVENNVDVIAELKETDDGSEGMSQSKEGFCHDDFFACQSQEGMGVFASFSLERDNGRQKTTSMKGKEQVDIVPSPMKEACTAKEVLKKSRREEASPESPNCHTSDSDFQEPPKKRRGLRHNATITNERGRQRMWAEFPRRNTGQHSERKPTSVRFEVGNDNDKESMLGHRKKIPPGEGKRKDILERNSSERIPLKRKALSKGMTFFPFQEVVEEEHVHCALSGSPSPSGADASGDDDFEERPSRKRTSMEIVEKPLVMESEARAIRKRKKVERDLEVQRREAAGQKPFYIMVNACGKPYGDDMTAWTTEVNKLSRALDPSIRDIRQQPHNKIQILKKRLTDNFEYSGIISDKYLLPILGHKVSARRNDLINKIRAGKACPNGVDKEVWERLECISESATFNRKSAAMRYANSCRQNVGRTGPSGEIGVRASLKQILRRSPNPEEVHAEMIRDKGYGGKKKTKQMAVHHDTTVVSVTGDAEGSQWNSEAVDLFRLQEFRGASKATTVNSRPAGLKESAMDHMDLISKLQAQIEELKAKMEATVPQFSSATGKAVDLSVTSAAPESSTQPFTDE